MSRFLNDKYSSLCAYTPGEQPIDKKYIKLNTNENPYPPSPMVLDAINDIEKSNLKLYPDPTLTGLVSAIAKNYSVLPENVIAGNGSDEILAFCFLAFCQNGACFADITYGFYKVFAALFDVSYETIPLCDNFSINPKDYYQKHKAIFIANPNAPTGLALSLSEIEEIVNQNIDSVIIIDEAYVDFGCESAVKLTEKYENLLVVSTFSKSRSLAGARIGFAIGNKELISDLNKMKYSFNPYNINRLSLLAGQAAMKDVSYFKNCVKKVIDTREKTSKSLNDLGFFVLPSKTNFIFAKHPLIDGEKLYLKLKDEGILIRHFSSERISDFIRISIGTDEEMEFFIYKIKLITEGLI